MVSNTECPESNSWLAQSITRLQTISQRAHVIHTREGDRALQFPPKMQGTTEINTTTSSDKTDESTLRLGDKIIYVKSLRRLKHYQQLEDEVMDAYLTKICIQSQGIKSSCIQSLYAQYFMDDELSYISNQRILAQLSRTNLLESNMVFLPIGRNGHSSLATANMRTQNIYY